MTRETKVGLVVSASFLCLVGVVLVCKFREGDSGKAPANPQANADEVVTSPDAAKTAAAPDQPKIVPVKNEEPHLQTVPAGPPPRQAAARQHNIHYQTL